MAAKPSCIDGIHEFCDRWCERCPLTARCRLYAQELSARKRDPAAGIAMSHSDQCGEQRAEAFLPTLAMLRRIARERGIDLDRIDVEEVVKLDPDSEALTLGDLLYKAAYIYAMKVHRWLTANDEVSRQWSECDDALEVIRWYQFFIAATMHRVAGQDAQATPELVPIKSHDANGSAKMVLCAIDRSVAAWCQLLNALPTEEKEILDLLVRLTKLRAETERAYPHARSFVRPGFDTARKGSTSRTASSEPSPV